MKRTFSQMKWPGMLLMAGCLAMTSCKKESKETKAPSETEFNQALDVAVSDQTAAEQFNDVFNITMGIGSDDAGEDIGIGTAEGILYRPGSGSSALGGAHCFTVTVTPKTLHQFPKTVTLDFGDGCVGVDGKLRKGSLVAIFTGPVLVPDNNVLVTFNDYSEDSFALAGTLTIQNTSTTGKFGWSMEVLHGKITNTESGEWKAWEGKRTHTQIEGNETPFNLQDDIYQITGKANGSSSNGNSWTSEITEPLIMKFTCKWPVKGILKIDRNDDPHSVMLNFGDGSCDNKATVSYMGISKEITLK